MILWRGKGGVPRPRQSRRRRQKFPVLLLRLWRGQGRRPKQDWGRKLILFRGKRCRLTPRSYPRRNPREQRDKGRRLIQGPRLRIKSRKKAEKTRKAREERSKLGAETVDRAGSWADAKAREKADIARLADEAREKNEFEARARKNVNVVNRAAV